jgi:hypothetical protein
MLIVWPGFIVISTALATSLFLSPDGFGSCRSIWINSRTGTATTEDSKVVAYLSVEAVG